jgi:hypothetical protein
MNVRRMILLAAGALLASRAGAQSESGGSSQPPSDQKSWYQKDADKAKELGQQGADAAKKGAESAGEKVNDAGQAATAKVVGTKTVTGKIADMSKDQLTVSAAGTPVNMHVTHSTQVTVDGEKSSFDSLKQGDQIRASYAHSGGESTATKLEVKRNSPTFPPSDTTPPKGTGSTSDSQ